MAAVSLILIAIAGGLALVLWRVLNPPPLLEISERGIRDRRLALGWLEWHAIEGAYRPRYNEGDRLLLRVNVDERLGRRLRRRKVQDPALPERLELQLDLTGTGYSEVEVLHEIMAHRQAGSDAQPPATAQATRGLCR